ncbi:MAG: hypothetical protein NC318_11660 [Blautia sp.]|nr:hypothetical protein [Blautia sp.]
MKNVVKRFINWIKLRIYEVLYIALLIILSAYILINWEVCVTMTFFDQFDGNNILFLIWIVLLILPFYDVEAKGWKFRKKGIEDTRKQYETAESNFMQNQINNIIDSMQSQNSEETNGGSGNNE